MPLPFTSRFRLPKDQLLEKAINVARRPADLGTMPRRDRKQIEPLVKALQVGSGGKATMTANALRNQRPVSAAVVAARAHQILGPSSNVTPVDIALAMEQQGLGMVEPFSPGQPLAPYYGYSREPRTFDYKVARNTTTETREDRVPFQTLYQLWKSYDIAQTCTRYSINDLRSMRIRFEAMEGYEENPTKEIQAAKKFLRRPDGRRNLRSFLAANQRNLWIYDSAPIYRQRDKAGRVKGIKNFSARTLAPMLDYFGEIPEAPAPAFQQFIEGVPWDWLTWDDVIYEPFWPETDSPYGTPPLETVLINANTDIRLQLYFLQFFTAGSVPEAFAIAPEDMTSGDDIADFEEEYYDYFHGDQSERWGLHWLPNGTELQFYKPQMFDPDLAEYVETRTIAAYGLTPQNLGILGDVNRATSETQVDQQFRVTTLPIVLYYEDLFDSILQDDLGLPVQVRFDTGREKEDRFVEAQAHQIYFQIGAESADEVREKVLGLPVNIEERVPRAVFDPRLGIIPLSHILAISGDVDPLTGAPRPGTVQRVPYVLPGTPGSNPETDNGQNGPSPAGAPGGSAGGKAGANGATPPVEVTSAGVSGTQYDDDKESDTKRGAGSRAGGARPKAGRGRRAPAWDPTKTYPTPLYPARPLGASKEATDDESNDESSHYPEVNSGSPQEAPGYGRPVRGSTAQGTGVLLPDERAIGAVGAALDDPKHTTYALKEGAMGGGGGATTGGVTSSTGLAGVDGGTSDDDDDDERHDLYSWQRQARKAVQRGVRPRYFESSAIRPGISDLVWSKLASANTRKEVDEAFDKARKKPVAAGIALVAADTGRILLVRRAGDQD